MASQPVSVETLRRLKGSFEDANILRPMQVDRYDPGDRLTWTMTGVLPANTARVTVEVEKFIGGGFAGQVYRVRVAEIEKISGPIDGLEVGRNYAIKILIPPSSGSRRFRDFVYAVGFQAPFSLQANPAAARAGALWQKFIRRAAGDVFGDGQSVVDIHATFVDDALGSCGEISEWVEGRTWRYEVDDHLFARRRWRRGDPDDGLGSPEYRAKKAFMAEFVDLLHRLGAHEFARQYEWWTCKSQPNALKRRDTDDEPEKGLTAVDFRAGLALLPFLPMAPGDVPLIARGIRRGSWVQFDRGNLHRLQAYVAEHPETFAGMDPAMEELKTAELLYRNSMPDVTHNGFRLLYDGQLWSTILDSSVIGWRIRNRTDDRRTEAFRKSRPQTVLFGLLGLVAPVSMLLALAVIIEAIWGATSIGGVDWSGVLWGGLLLGLVVPVLSRLVRGMWGREVFRQHLGRLATSPGYLMRTFRARRSEALARWHRAGRVSGPRAEKLDRRPLAFAANLPLSVLPPGLHRMLTDWSFAKAKLAYIFVRPVVLYFRADAREQWMRDMVEQGRKHHMLTDDDAKQILDRMDEPYIQKYLQSLAVHVCTLPVTQVVSIATAWIYVAMHPEMTTQQAAAAVAGILVAFQITPLSPGSLVRGLYVLYLVIRERNFKDYNIAVFLGFFKYIGYLAFPIQMAYRYPVLARFMASHWATGAVHVVPVFGERGALLEHAVFDLFYNRPLTLRRLLYHRTERRKELRPRAVHAPVASALAATAMVAAVGAFFHLTRAVPQVVDLWFVALPAALWAGWWAAQGAGGMHMGRRIILGTLTGLLGGLLVVAAMIALGGSRELIGLGIWTTFTFAVFATIGAIAAEVHFPRSEWQRYDREEGLQADVVREPGEGAKQDSSSGSVAVG